MMNKLVGSLAALLLAGGTHALASEFPRQWMTGLDEGRPYLSFGVAESDDLDLVISCSVKTGKVTVSPHLAVPADADGLRLPLRLSSSGGDMDLTAQATWNDVFLRVDLEAQATIAAIDRVLAGTDALQLATSGLRIAIPLQNGANDAVIRFRNACSLPSR